MKRLFAALTVSLSIATPISAQTRSNVQIPAQQKALTDILSKYNNLHESAPNSIQRDRIDSDFKKVFCAAIPKGNVAGWIGDVDTIDNDSPSKGIRLVLGVSTQDLSTGGLGIELSLGNFPGYGISARNIKPHAETIIPVGSPLYRVVSNLRSGDTVIFSGTFIPYSSPQACYQNDTTYFSLVRFSTIRKIGWGVTF